MAEDKDKTKNPPEVEGADEGAGAKPTPTPKRKKNPGDELIQVRSTQKEAGKNGSWKQAFWEVNENHPNGELWIADGKIHLAAKTSKLMQAITDEKIELVED